MDENRQPAGARAAAPIGRATRHGGRARAASTEPWSCAACRSLLGRLYDVELPYDVYDFLVTDRRSVGGFAPENDRRATGRGIAAGRESVDGAGVALYLDPELLRRLESADPHRALTEDNLADYCTALEGVSHFVYSTWRLDRDMPVSLLELETQAEVDKYAVTVFLLGSSRGPRPIRRTCMRACSIA